MQGHDGFARAGRTGDARGAVVIASGEAALFGVQEDRPFFPGIFEGARQFFHVAHDAEAAQSIGMVEGIGNGGRRRGGLRRAAYGQFEQRFGSFRGQVVGQFEDIVLGGSAHIRQPFGRDAIAEQFVIR